MMCSLLSAILGSLVVVHAEGGFPHVPLRRLVVESDLIVAGVLTDVRDDHLNPGLAQHHAGRIDIRSVLWPKDVDLKSAWLAWDTWPGSPNLDHSANKSRLVLWLLNLTRISNSAVYRADYPSQAIGLDSAAACRALTQLENGGEKDSIIVHFLARFCGSHGPTRKHPALTGRPIQFPSSPLGYTFVSEEELAGGLSPDGYVGKMNWRLHFGGEVIDWAHEDMLESFVILGVKPGFILAREYGGTNHEAKYDPTRGRVLWQGRAYIIEPAEKK